MIKKILFIIVVMTMISVGVIILYSRYVANLQANAQQTVVLGPLVLAPKSQGSLRLLVRDVSKKIPLQNANVQLTLKSSKKTWDLGTAITDKKGNANVVFDVPEVEDDFYNIEIKTISSIGKDIQELTVSIKKEYKILLTTDKPLYQPGQKIHIRTITMNKYNTKPVQKEKILVEVSDSKGNKVFKKEIRTSDFGIAACDFELATEINEGIYSIKAVCGKISEEKQITIDNYVLPKFKVNTNFDKNYYLPGQVVNGQVNTSYFFGKPVANSKVEVNVSILNVPSSEFVSWQGTTNQQGLCNFSFSLPPKIYESLLEENNVVRVEIKVTDNGNHSQQITQNLVVSQASIDIVAIPDSTNVVAHIPNTIYLCTAYPDGTPAITELEANGKKIITNDLGIAEFEVTPSKFPYSFSVVAKDQNGNSVEKTIEFDNTLHTNFTATLDRASYQAGDSVFVKILSTHNSDNFYVDLVKEKQSIASYVVEAKNQKGKFSFVLPQDVSGALKVCVYRVGFDNIISYDARLIFVSPKNNLDIQIQKDKEVYRPGDNAIIDFSTNINEVALSISIVDESVFALQEMQPGIEKVYFMLERELLLPKHQIHYSSPLSSMDVINLSHIEKQQNEREQSIYKKRQQATKVMFAVATEVENYIQQDDSYVLKLERMEQQKRNYFNNLSNFIRNLFFGIGGLICLATLVIFLWKHPKTVSVFIIFCVLGILSAMLLPALSQVSEKARQSKFRGDMDVEQNYLNSQEKQQNPRIRKYFPETLYWNPELITNNGKAQINIPVSDSITTFRMVCQGIGRDGQLGSAMEGLRVFQDFFVDIDFPTALTQNDIVSVPVQVYNYLKTSQRVRLAIQKEDWFELVGESEQNVIIDANQVSVVHFTIQARRVGERKLTISAYGSQMSDAVERSVYIEPDGKKIEKVTNDSLVKTVEHECTIPEDAISEASEIIAKCYPGIASVLVEGLDGMLQLPHGCFEQTSSTSFPNILVVDYLKRTRRVSPQIMLKAENYLNIGYQKILAFERPGGGFDWWGKDPAIVWLTAYGIQQLTALSKVKDIDTQVIDRAYRFLQKKENSNGSWGERETDKRTIAHISDSNFALTSYVVWSLAKAQYKNLRRNVRFLKQNIGKAKDDPYLLALVANALLALDSKDSVGLDILEQLQKLQVEENNQIYWKAIGKTASYAYGEAANIETTALVVLAMIESGTRTNTVNKALQYIIKSKDSRGTWGSTQATILALQCLVSADILNYSGDDSTVAIIINNERVTSWEINNDNRDVMQVVNLQKYTCIGKNHIKLEVTGKPNVMYQIATRYYEPNLSKKAETSIIDLDISYDRTILSCGDSIVANANLSYHGKEATYTVIVDLGIPLGFSIDPDDFAKLPLNLVEHYSITPSRVILYLGNINPEDNFNFNYTLKANYPLKIKTPKSTAYEYYSPNIRDETESIVLEVVK